MVLLSLIIFCIPECMEVEDDSGMGWFFGNFLFTLVYFFMLFIGKRLFRRKGRGVHGIFLVLLLLSAYSLNRGMNVFQSTTPWFCTVLVISCINYLALPYRTMMPVWLRHVQSFMFGISLCCFLYLSCYLIPLYVFGILLFFVLGVSLHAFVALLFFIYTILLTKRLFRVRSYRISFWSGIGTAAVILIAFCVTWGVTVNRMNALTLRTDKSGLPAWVAVAQHTARNTVAQRILKSDLVYTTPGTVGADFFWSLPDKKFNEQKEHDPLVMTAAFICGMPALDEDDRIKVLESMYDSRYQAAERLWSDDNLFTAHVNTVAHIWPRLHMAYTEKTVTVTNSLVEHRWGSQQEAIYTFHLPEGAVVSSLSLWINNKEEKGILTTKAKADSAYKQIVGVESRDPSVVHWQEGNTVAVRVFPVVGGKSRQFKIGITAPLIKDGNQLVYRNIYFDGPSPSHAIEDISVSFENPPAELIIPSRFDMDKQTLEKHGGYNAAWEVAFNDEGIAPNVFGANGRVFNIAPYKKELTATNVRNIYLDINKAWTKQEFEDILSVFKNEQKWVYYEGQLSMVNDKNASGLFKELHEQQFSLFPLWLISDPAKSMLITKGVSASPAITDLEGDFVDRMKRFLSEKKKVMLFNLGGELSPYMRSLKECRAFRYEQGEMTLLKQRAANHSFPADIENEQRVVVEPADIMITAMPGTCTPTAPDHLQRLFAYNHIMQQTGANLLYDLPDGNALVEEAKEAYIVTPFSSLVVLETQEDYDRFNIADSENSLKNASIQSKGAVPEPHEWALIILAVLMLIYVKFQPFKKRLSI
jgi:XrtN system VIT domain protein